MGIGSRLQMLIIEKGTNVNELAVRAKVSPNTLYSIIKRDNTKVEIDVLISIAKILGVPVEYFSDKYADSYYTNPETAVLAQSIHDNPELRILMDASRDLSPEDVKFVAEMVQRMKKKERGDID